MEKKLSQFSIGETGTVKSIQCEEEVKRRLADMGLVVGVEVTLNRVAPLRDPMQISLRGYKLAIRKHEASLIVMEV
ncbi:MAG: ferrous iron transport protein A [Erysipelotrichaceae bacterium]|nr:ferrous iron transport protein A [Erysipelotrichaceae bacterium]